MRAKLQACQIQCNFQILLHLGRDVRRLNEIGFDIFKVRRIFTSSHGECAQPLENSTEIASGQQIWLIWASGSVSQQSQTRSHTHISISVEAHMKASLPLRVPTLFRLVCWSPFPKTKRTSVGKHRNEWNLSTFVARANGLRSSVYWQKSSSCLRMSVWQTRHTAPVPPKLFLVPIHAVHTRPTSFCHTYLCTIFLFPVLFQTKAARIGDQPRINNCVSAASEGNQWNCAFSAPAVNIQVQYRRYINRAPDRLNR